GRNGGTMCNMTWSSDVLFVCSGNTCRSPLAAALFRRALRGRGVSSVEVSSAGLAAVDGEPASRQARDVAREWGLDLEAHRSRRLTPEMVAGAGLVLTMSEQHKRQVLEMVPGAAGRVFTLAEYAGSQGDVDDPFGQDLERYRATVRELDALTREAAARFETQRAAAQERAAVPAAAAAGEGPLAGEAVRRAAVGWDHAGRALRDAVVESLRQGGLEVREYGPQGEETVDYPDVAVQVARAVAAGEVAFGVLMCGTGIGMSITANKVRGVRAALCHDPYSARMARAHNDANVLAMGGRVLGPGVAAEVVKAFMEGRFEGGRHARRVEKIRQAESAC
ncbi:MAG: ribose 5-phosphate isomerase B, partial [Bacillota bacterium]